MANYEERMRREMEEASAEHQIQPQCPVDGEVNAAFGIKRFKTGYKPLKGKGGALRRAKRQNQLTKNPPVKSSRSSGDK